MIASLTLWAVWLLAWTLAGVWARRTQTSASLPFQVGISLLTGLSFVLLFGGARAHLSRAFPLDGSGFQLWTLPAAVDWGLFGLCVAGFVFAWWARFTLGDLWSASVTRKEGHTIIQTGPYRLVRHPIYTGMLLAGYAMALETGRGSALAGAILLHLTFWAKARVEESFLQAELGEAAYADYRRRTPMLIPFLKGAS